MKKKLVVHSNALIRSTHGMSLTELKLMYYCTTKVRRNGGYSDENRHFDITQHDFAKAMGLKNNYAEMKSAALRLQQRIILIDEKIVDTDGTVWDGGAISVLSAQKWQEGEGKIRLSFAPEFMPYLTKLSGHFTKHYLESIEPMKSLYAVRIYSMAISHHNQHENNSSPPRWVIEVEELRRIFELQNKYKLHANFRKKVIDVAVEEINKHSDILIKYVPVKKGRRIHAYSFEIKRKKQPYSLKPTRDKNAVKKAIRELKEALGMGLDVRLLGKDVREVNGAVVSFKCGTSMNLYNALIEADCVFEVG